MFNGIPVLLGVPEENWEAAKATGLGWETTWGYMRGPSREAV